MRISYKKLWLLLLERELATGTMAKLNKGEEVALSVLMRICQYLRCDIGDICSVILEEKSTY